MFSHITVGCTDLEASCRFYDAVLPLLGLRRRAVVPDGGPPSACWVHPVRRYPRFYVYVPFDGRPGTAGNGAMTAFIAPSPAAVDAAHAAALAHGGTDEGAPGLRPHYAADYHGAYVRDTDGNKLHFVHREELVREAAG